MVRATVAKRRHAIAWDASPRNKAHAVSKSRSDGMCSPATPGTHAVTSRLCIAAPDDLGLASQAVTCHCFAVIKTSRSPLAWRRSPDLADALTAGLLSG